MSLNKTKGVGTIAVYNSKIYNVLCCININIYIYTVIIYGLHHVVLGEENIVGRCVDVFLCSVLMGFSMLFMLHYVPKHSMYDIFQRTNI